ncbi:MAG: TonB-dependent receptor, partial [Bacteroidota bacterium]
MFRKLLCLAFAIPLYATSVFAGTITGKVSDLEDRPLAGATIKLLDTKKGALANEKGVYKIQNVKAGTYTLQITFLGYQTVEKKIEIKAAETLEINFKLVEKAAEIGEVVITERSISRQLSENPIQISSIDVTKLQSESSDVVSVLDRTAGVRIRQAGGLGSSTTIQLNGLSGRAVRTYYDGIPLELLGGGIQLNNIPVNAIERVDVYKGVMPVDVGTDALAGGINVITKQVDYDYLDASYQIGSFNTHVGTLNASKKLGKHLNFSISGFYNYSDNNYNIRARQRTPDFKEIEVEVERFHSAHQSSMIMGTIGLVNVKWADKLSYSASYNQRFDEIQHGVRIGNNAVGEAEIRRNAFLHIFRYQKALFDDKLVIDY